MYEVASVLRFWVSSGVSAAPQSEGPNAQVGVKQSPMNVPKPASLPPIDM